MDVQAVKRYAAPAASQRQETAQTKSTEKTTSPSALPKQTLDRLELSKSLNSLFQNQAEQSSLLDLLSPTKEENSSEYEALKKAMEDLELCAKIAARIRAGDNVPMEDMNFLLNKDPTLYIMAVLMRQAKEDPKDWDSLLPKEEEEAVGPTTAESDGDSVASASAAASGSTGSGDGGSAESGGESSPGAP